MATPISVAPISVAPISLAPSGVVPSSMRTHNPQAAKLPGRDASHPEQQRAGTDNQKVPLRPRMQSHTPCVTSFTCCWHPTDLPRGLPFAVPVDRVPRLLCGSGSRFYTRRARVGAALLPSCTGCCCSERPVVNPHLVFFNTTLQRLCDLSMSLNCSNRTPNLEP